MPRVTVVGSGVAAEITGKLGNTVSIRPSGLAPPSGIPIVVAGANR